MRRTVVFVVFGALVLVGIVGSLLLHLFRPDASATFVTQLSTLLGLVTVFAGTAYGLGKTNDKLDQVQKQTNGQLEKRDAEIERLNALLVGAGVNPHDKTPAAEPDKADEGPRHRLE